MREKIDAFLFGDEAQMTSTLQQLKESRFIRKVHLLGGEVTERLMSSETLAEIEEKATADYVLLYLKATPLTIGYGALRRLLRVAVETEAMWVYADRYSVENGTTVKHPVIDYQQGSVRDDFDFGSVLLIRADGLHDYVSQADPTLNYQYAALYDLRLFLSRKGSLFHLNEYLYTEEESDLRTSGEKQFDYVNPANRDVQIEMEKAVTAHLKEIGALVGPADYVVPDFNEQKFEVEASVIIPVFNREKTIADAVKSALAQKNTFPFNVIVVDNHSTDKTGEILHNCQQSTANGQLVVLKPIRHDLGIGGCWNMAINDEHCGRFAVQLDSDDLYSSPDTLHQIV